MKAAWLTRNRLRDTSQIEPACFKDGGHDLTIWTKRLKLPATVTGANVSFRLRDAGTRLQLKFAHQAWRYGVDMEPADEAALHQWLEQVWQWTKGELLL